MEKLKKISAAVISLSALSILSGAAVAPALGHIRESFADYPATLVQMIVSLPALFIILTSACFPLISRMLRLKKLTTAALIIYICAGACCYFSSNIWVILALRALLGVSIGIIMPLTTGLIPHFFPVEYQGRMMGLSAAMNEFGSLIATICSGVLTSISWHHTFLVYLVGIIPMILVLLFIPDDYLASTKVHLNAKDFRKYHPCIIGIMLTMMLFFIFPTNFAMISSTNPAITFGIITLLMMGRDLLALFVDLSFGKILARFPKLTIYGAPIGFMLCYICLSMGTGIEYLILGVIFSSIGNGLGIPHLNTLAAKRGGKTAVLTVMPMMSAAFFVGEFLSPLVVNPVAHMIGSTQAPYMVGVGLSIVYLIQTVANRKFLDPSAE